MALFLIDTLQDLLADEFVYNLTDHPIRTAIIGSIVTYFVYVQLQADGIKSIDNATSAMVDVMYDVITWVLMSAIHIMTLPILFVVNFFEGIGDSLVEESKNLKAPKLEFKVNTKI